MQQWVKTVGAALHGVIVTVGFCGTAMMLYFVEIPTSQEKFALIILGALISEFRSVGSYWTGSTSSSASKDETISEIAKGKGAGP